MKKTKDIISQENKFLRLCGEKYKDKIKKRSPMTVGDFKKFMYLFDAMGLSKYSIYFSMEMFPELLVEYGELLWSTLFVTFATNILCCISCLKRGTVSIV